MDAIVRLDSTNVSSNALLLPVPGAWAGFGKEAGPVAPAASAAFCPRVLTFLQSEKVMYTIFLSSF